MAISPIKLHRENVPARVEKTTANTQVTFTGVAEFLNTHLAAFADPACKVIATKTNRESQVSAVTVSGPFDRLAHMDRVLSSKPNAVSLYSGFTTPLLEGRISETAFKNLDEVLLADDPRMSLLGKWIKRHIGFIFAQNGFTLSSILTTAYPLTVVFERPKSTLEEAQALVETFENSLRLTFRKGLEGGYTPFARISNSFNADANYVYLVITYWASGKITVKIGGH